MSVTDDELATMEAHLVQHLAVTQSLRPQLATIGLVAARLRDALSNGHRVYAFGNGGSAADAQHLAAELIGRYLRERDGLAALSLTSDPSVVTCIANDYGFEHVFSRQLSALARPGDIAIGFTTSGTSANVVNGLAAARTAGATTVLIGAGTGGDAAVHSDHSLLVDSDSTARCQEMHGFVVHLLCDAIDRWAGDART